MRAKAQANTNKKYFVLSQLPYEVGVVRAAYSGSSGTLQNWSGAVESATMNPLLFFSATGSIIMPFKNASVLDHEPEPEYFDDLDREIALMSDEEILEAVMDSAGMWADRDDLEEVFDRSDGLEELYDFLNTDDTNSTV